MRIYIWHGYLLRGTGSNEYTRALATTLAQRGHDVTVFCQDPDEVDLAGAQIIRPIIPGRLPVFVLDRYDQAEPAFLPDMSHEETQAFVTANAEAIRAAGPADLLITNHVLMGGPVGEASGLPFIVKAHGSELEYAMRGNPMLCDWAARSLKTAQAVVAGSEHIRSVVTDLVGVPSEQITVIPPGVDTGFMRPLTRAEALVGLLSEASRDEPNRGNPRLPDDGNAQRLAEFFESDEPAVAYVGKVSQEKGVPLLVDVLKTLGLRAVIVGFGPARLDLESNSGPELLFTGALEHRHLRYLWPLCSASVVPSVFPEAFGMVAAEAAACGCPPLVADHTGLAEIAAGLRQYYPSDLADLTAFRRGDTDELAARLTRIIDLDDTDRARLTASAREAAVELWSWDSVAERILALIY